MGSAYEQMDYFEFIFGLMARGDTGEAFGDLRFAMYVTWFIQRELQAYRKDAKDVNV